MELPVQTGSTDSELFGETCSFLICMDVVFLKHNSGIMLRTEPQRNKYINVVIYQVIRRQLNTLLIKQI